ncbi:MAG: hypothetical protein ACLRPV_05650 [Lacrimispora saccharolytica]
MPQVEGYIQRKSMLYKTGVGMEIILWVFVPGMCTVAAEHTCYTFLMKKIWAGQDMRSWLKPYLVSTL